jgi:hypothetical protein
MENKTYRGLIKKLPDNCIFVFGANTEGRHGAGAAKFAKENFGAIEGKVALQGRSYGIITKDLRCSKHPSIPQGVIVSQIETLYLLADYLNKLDFYIAYSATGTNLNYYSSQQMANMFRAAEIPENIIFEEGFSKLIYD